MSSPTTAAAAKGGHNFGNDRLYHSDPLVLPTIIEETETWSKKVGTQKTASCALTKNLPDQGCAKDCSKNGDNDSEKSCLDGSFWTGGESYQEEEDVHLMSRSAIPFVAAHQTAEKRASANNDKPRRQHSQICFSNNDNKSSNDDEEDDYKAETRSSSSPSSTYDHRHHQDNQKQSGIFQNSKSTNNGLLSSLVAQRVLSTLIKPFKSSNRALYQSKRSRSRRNRRTQTDHHSYFFSHPHSLSQHRHQSLSQPDEMKRPPHHQYTRLFQAPSLVRFSNGGSSGFSGRLLLWTKHLLRQLRLPLAIFAFVFLFVIQFRANQQPPQHIIGGLQQQQFAAANNIADANSAPAPASLTYFNPSSSSSETVASAIVGNFSSAVKLNAAFTDTNSTTTAKSSAIISVAAPVSSDVLVNRDLQAMPAAVAGPPAQVDGSSEIALSVSSSSIVNNSSIVVSDTYNNNNTVFKTLSKPPCPLIPSKLVGRLKVLRHAPPMTELETLLADVQVGGRYTPTDCTPKYKVAIIVPYRDRDEHLRAFLYNIHPMLMRQNIEYGIFIVEQSGSDRFNRAKLMNVGFLEARNHLDYDCFIFHDVDLIPEDDRNLYTCPEQPRHMSVAIDKFRYRLPYKDLFGGVSALTREQFETVNGFSNEFWGWGGEDDDMSNRVRHHKFKITRYKPEIARYTMLKHQQDAPSAERYKKLYNGWRRYDSDGINSTKYTVLDTTFKKLYTWILVDIFPPPMAKKKAEIKRSKLMHSSRLFRSQNRYFPRRPI